MAETRNCFRTVVACAALIVCCGCGNPCEAEKEDIRNSLQQAESAHAALYAPRDFERAAGAVREFEKECSRQQGRFFLFRSYRQAQSAANAAKSLSEAASEKGRMAEGLVRQEALNARYEAGMALNEAFVAVQGARTLKGNPAAEALVGRLDALRASLVAMQQMLERGSLLEAREKAVGIRKEATRLLAEANRAAPPGSPK